MKHRQEHRKLDSHLQEQFSTNRLYAAISSRPGQSGRADGYILEGAELEFYLKKLAKKGKEKKESAEKPKRAAAAPATTEAAPATTEKAAPVQKK